ncbi:MAG: hypothetical protein IPH93_07515 [Saprospiraceae bacterium]|nr:hypothetical protein [Saprospiraceae bacterium]
MSQYRLWRHKFATAIQYVLQFATAIRYYFYRKDRSRRLRPTVVVCRSTAYGGINLLRYIRIAVCNWIRYYFYRKDRSRRLRPTVVVCRSTAYGGINLQLRFDTIFIECMIEVADL